MSKNVAVFVDVANIFYAAKAAGVDIDYVTLLKSAIAGRDFVRAYAYTGLDPENENQRQFHSFLARSGYKVVSKDVRKYGDGKVKANLDIELVVDLMRTAVNLDVAVVVSGDGDFAPAIRAVQQQGVRVEVISFRGNTSSDLIEVADSFTDITQVAKVEKGSRSGRRVAAEGDLSMTEVPEKETEGTGRRRRTPRTRRETPAAAPTGRRVASRTPALAPSAAASAAGLVVLPGEKLARAGSSGAPEDVAEDTEVAGSRAEATDAAVSGERVAAGAIDDDESPAGRRRRRRRGGRGRGRGRGAQPELSLVEGGLDADSGAEAEADPEDEAEFDTPPRAPQTTFGSVWDSQLGVPASGTPLAEAGSGDETDVEEPEIPEYLLAERRQQRQRPPQRGRGGGRAAAYQSAVERERFGRPAGGGGSARPAGGGSGGGFTSRRPPQRGVRGRPPRPVPAGPDRFAPRPSVGGDPWSEVPPELEQLLRAQLTQSGGRPAPREDGHQRSSGSETQAASTASAEAPAEAAPKRSRSPAAARGKSGPGTRPTRTRPVVSADDDAAPVSAEADASAASETGAKAAAPRRRSATPATTRRRSTEAGGAPAGEADSGTSVGEPTKTTRRRATPRSRAAEPPSEG